MTNEPCVYSQGFFGEWGKYLMCNILFSAAEAFDKVIKYDYIYTLGTSKRIVKISVLSNQKHDFTHIFGIDHLTDVPALVGTNSEQKRAIYNNILKKKITDEHIKESQKLNSYIRGTFNAATKSEYTIRERIVALKDLEYILDNSYKGKLYRWNIKNSQILQNDGKIRRSKINADYLLVVPSDRCSEESYYIFLYQTNKDKRDEPIMLNVFSAFPDCINLARGQAGAYTVLELVKKEHRVKNEKLLYINPSYKKELDCGSESDAKL